ncbi:hypothetical protein O4H61_18670 [Roseovarius aestuarii]|nr:hypothetical protein [Roseovarius aestuarii]
MSSDKTPKKPAKTGKTREDRLKQALKANLARRKAQSRARGAAGGDSEQGKG